MPPAKTVSWIVVSALGVGMLCVPATAISARLVWNFTPSIPVGLYRIEDREWALHDLVALKPSGRLAETLLTTGVLKEGRLLMKRVVAVTGQRVCRFAETVSVNGRTFVEARPDSKLPTWSGCIVLGADEVFLLGDTPDSFDGRYFGPTSARDIVGPLAIVIAFDQDG